MPTSSNVDIVEGKLGCMAALGLALTTPEPRVVGAPAGDSKGHSVLKVFGHILIVPAVSFHHNGVTTLRDRVGVRAEVRTVSVKGHLDVHPLQSVDLEITAGTVLVIRQILHVVSTSAASVTFVVVAV